MLTAEQTASMTTAIELISRRAGHTPGPGQARRAGPLPEADPYLCAPGDLPMACSAVQATDGELSLFAQMPAEGERCRPAWYLWPS